VTTGRWFLPHSPDVLGALRAQTAVTVDGLDALARWAAGDEAAAERVRECEHLADDRKRELRAALSEAFSTPLEPEDIFQLSTGLDRVMNAAKNIVREAEVLERLPDPPMAELAAALAEGTHHLAEAFAALGDGGGQAATAAADAALESQRPVERAYRAGMSGLLGLADLHEVAARRELYRRLARTSDGLVDVAERVWYSVLKES
jgi:uncharacterized protein Yka (UPF0111/DUF47 family)